VDQVLRVLEEDWQDPLRCTNLEQAFHRAGVAFEDGTRRRVAGAIPEDAGLRELLRWHPSAYFLTNEERLVAPVVLRTLRLRAAAEERAWRPALRSSWTAWTSASPFVGSTTEVGCG